MKDGLIIIIVMITFISIALSSHLQPFMTTVLEGWFDYNRESR